MMFKRKIMNEIYKWEESLKIKKRALVVKRLRYVGKTTIVKIIVKINIVMLFILILMSNHH